MTEEIYQTKRPTVAAMEAILFDEIKILDHGFIRVVDYMGDDKSVVDAARVSYGKGTKHVSQDKGLINYLMRHKHTTPFEMCEIKLHVKLPIFMARHWIRHRTANVNEYSARYSFLDNDFYLPSYENIAPQSKTNKQCREGDSVPKARADEVLAILKDDALRCHRHYIEMMNEDEQGNIIDENKVGIARELARINLTLNHYTQWYWKIDLHNLMHFLNLRAHNHAQYEIRVYAEVIKTIVKAWVPLCYSAFEEYVAGSTSISNKGTSIVKQLLRGEIIDQAASGLSKREWNDLMNSLELNDKIV